MDVNARPLRCIPMWRMHRTALFRSAGRLASLNNDGFCIKDGLRMSRERIRSIRCNFRRNLFHRSEAMSTAVSSEFILNLGRVDRIPLGEGRTFRLGPRAIAVFRSHIGSVFATQALCPHEGGPLAGGIIREKNVICPLHAGAFDLDNGKAIGNAGSSLITYPVRIDDAGNILITLGRRDTYS
jgi:nitrite reductase (NADH) small subunit